MYPNTDSLQHKRRYKWHGTRKDRDIQRFVEDVGHLVLKVLGGHCDDKHRVRKEKIYTKRLGDEPRGLRSFSQYLPLRATISPQAPPTLELISNAFQR
jgi:hypothetical protein